MLYKCKRIMLNLYKQIMYYRYKPIMLSFLFSCRYPKSEALCFGQILLCVLASLPWSDRAMGANDIANPVIARVSIRHYLIASNDVL